MENDVKCGDGKYHLKYCDGKLLWNKVTEKVKIDLKCGFIKLIC